MRGDVSKCTNGNILVFLTFVSIYILKHLFDYLSIYQIGPLCLVWSDELAEGGIMGAGGWAGHWQRALRHSSGWIC